MERDATDDGAGSHTPTTSVLELIVVKHPQLKNDFTWYLITYNNQSPFVHHSLQRVPRVRRRQILTYMAVLLDGHVLHASNWMNVL